MHREVLAQVYDICQGKKSSLLLPQSQFLTVKTLLGKKASVNNVGTVLVKCCVETRPGSDSCLQLMKTKVKLCAYR